MRLSIVSAAVAVLAVGSAMAEEVDPRYGAAMSAYKTCNYRKAVAFAAESGDPMSLGLAARGACQQAAAELQNTLLRHFRPDLVNTMIANAREMALEFNVATIVQTRAGQRR